MDIGGMGLLLVGGLCYVRAYLGMIALRDNGIAPGSGRFAGVAQFDRYWQLSQLGLAMSAVAIAVMVGAAVVTWRARRAAAAVADPVAQ